MNKLIVKAQNVVANKKAEMYVSKVIWILATIVVGMLLMVIVYNLMSEIIAERLKQAVTSIFDRTNEMNASVPTAAPAPGIASN